MTKQSETIKKNIQNSHDASCVSRYMQSGLTDQKVKLSPINFDKLMEQRRLTAREHTNLKVSSQQRISLQVRYVKVGEKFVTTHGTERSFGIFVSDGSLGTTLGERINKDALLHSNTAEFETTVELSKDQNLGYGQIAPQSKFLKMDPN